MRRFAWALLLMGVSSSVAMAEETSCTDFGANGVLPAVVRPVMQAGSSLLCNRGYAVRVSDVSHSPLWAAEHLWSDDIEAALKLPRPEVMFSPDPRWPASATLEDYRGAWIKRDLERGHMAPSGDQPNQQDQAETFLLSNIVPQTASLNEGIWAKIEQTVRYLAEDEGELYVVTGPAYHLHPIEKIGPDQVFVPSATWKAVYSPVRQKAGAYVCKNAQKHPHCDQVTIRTLIDNTGVDPFPGVPMAVKEVFWKMPAPRHFKDENE